MTISSVLYGIWSLKLTLQLHSSLTSVLDVMDKTIPLKGVYAAETAEDDLTLSGPSFQIRF